MDWYKWTFNKINLTSIHGMHYNMPTQTVCVYRTPFGTGDQTNHVFECKRIHKSVKQIDNVSQHVLGITLFQIQFILPVPTIISMHCTHTNYEYVMF